MVLSLDSEPDSRLAVGCAVGQEGRTSDGAVGEGLPRATTGDEGTGTVGAEDLLLLLLLPPSLPT